MNDFIVNDWLTIITLAIQAGLLKFAYNIYKDYANKEKIEIVPLEVYYVWK